MNEVEAAVLAKIGDAALDVTKQEAKSLIKDVFGAAIGPWLDRQNARRYNNLIPIVVRAIQNAKKAGCL